ncbi:non-canonical purine NTP pyrophosphatase, RdgB/HAM1 family [Campylobacter sp. MIT 99-7217]|uniref:RdgB/HAM1 family non-canonical purine NTP pyrophosphatase n=1 Tax=Campylobacter sp. MIT 99-7217 TaxID=535091 RepID=UPI001157453F|nr:RdgB/HAM1 family non-canonical purine NTP pyrophosphatase [Campylobacter sp. MIT 99-7217]TQR34403.1 non-canonical purine NTP pyrophosphatase, RdgB/HAM1 family [Campylobacter sp. MIT 99-7217]
MKILLASSNSHKLKELKALLKNFEIYAFHEVLTPFEIEENGTSFKQNAMIKAKAVFEALDERQKKEFIVLSDDSGVCVEALNNAPGIYSARFSPEKTDLANNALLIKKLKDLNLQESKAYYVACIAAKGDLVEFCTHGYLHGKIITSPKGENGFGYDPLFIPKNYDKTLAELKFDEKAQISHRSKALEYMRICLQTIKEK